MVIATACKVVGYVLIAHYTAFGHPQAHFMPDDRHPKIHATDKACQAAKNDAYHFSAQNFDCRPLCPEDVETKRIPAITKPAFKKTSLPLSDAKLSGA